MFVVRENGHAWTNVSASLCLILPFFGPAPVPETWAPLRGPKLDTKLRPEPGHPLWVPTFFVVKWGLFWGLGFGYGISTFFRCPFRGKTNPRCSKHLTGCTSNCTRQRHPSANDTKSPEEHLHKRFPHEGWLPRDFTLAMFVDDYHRECIPIRRI